MNDTALSNPRSISFETVVAEELGKLRPPVAGADRDEQPLSALCISGGGIRSATFALGAIQGLAEQGVLADFDYLSTVSGGGYIGGWLTSWKDRAGGLDKILPKLSPRACPPEPGELDPIGHLREYNHYLSPRVGFFSADTWTLAATVIRNMALNWLVMVPLLLAALLAPRLFVAVELWGVLNPAAVSRGIAAPLLIASGILLAFSTLNTMRYLPGVGNTNHTEKDFLRFCLLPLVLAVSVFITYDSWFDPSAVGPLTPTYMEMVLWVVGACGAGWLGYIGLWLLGFAQKPGRPFALGLAIVLTGVSAGTSAWVLVNRIHFQNWSTYTTIGPVLLFLAFITAGGVFTGVTSGTLGDSDREWLARAGAWILLLTTVWAGVCALVLIAPKAILPLSALAQSKVAAAGGLAGWLCSMAGFASQTFAHKDNGKDTPSTKTRALDLAAKLSAPLFVVVLLVALVSLTSWLQFALNLVPKDPANPNEDWRKDYEFLVDHTSIGIVLAAALAFVILGWTAARYININKFSLHAMYRNRLIRAWLGASNDRSKANKFIGFTDSDNIWMKDLDAGLRPFHVVNMTLNLVGGRRLEWQQRKAESFTASSLHAGTDGVGYQPVSEYGGPHGISLGTALTISGAAASPNMGYHSVGVIGFIMTLFNARLGAWLANPGPSGANAWNKDGPGFAVGSLVKEAFGLTGDKGKFVYLSDGGHFENLGLYEMVKRRCRLIVVLDSGCDPKFEYADLGNALRKIRIDTGVSIEFDDALMKPLRGLKKRCAFANILYSKANGTDQDGVLVYVKPMMVGNEPPDVSAYCASNPGFPHQSTGNQWYDESQTESYRMLGLHSIQEMCSGWNKAGGLSALFEHLRKCYLAEPATH
jgi:Patatin-like phospholipase